MNTRREFLKTVGLGAAALAVPRTVRAAKAATKPNVILVMTDDQGYGDLACHGNKVIRTPNLDRLHEKSVRLTDFHVSPVCSPTRAALMTGRCPNRVGVWHVVMGRSLLRPEEVTMADVFSANGYKTAIFGKWHLGDNYPYRPQDRGFGQVLVHGGGVVGHVPDYWLNNYFDDTYLHNGKWRKFRGYCTDVWFDGAMKFIEANKDHPFFCYIPTNVPHGPFLVAKKYSDLYAGKKAPAAFYGMITQFDESMGRLMAKLTELKLADNTILIFLTDNGSSSGSRTFNAGMRSGKGSEYDGGHRVPCWIRWDGGGLDGGRDVARLTGHVDILPTLIDLCGLKGPKGVKFDGRSIVPLLRGGDKAPSTELGDRALIVELQNVVDRPIKWRRCAVMTDRWRLVNGRGLYDIKADPGQRRNVAAKHPDVVKRLRAEYERWWADVSQGHAGVSEIVLGSDRENPARLTAYHWNNSTGKQSDMPWGQAHIVAGLHHNGYWAVRIERQGTYQFSLRRWPAEAGLAINETSDANPPEKPGYLRKAKPLIARRARLKIQDFDQTLPVKEGAKAVTFKAALKAGSARLTTWFMDEHGGSRGAYYVSVKRL